MNKNQTASIDPEDWKNFDQTNSKIESRTTDAEDKTKTLNDEDRSKTRRSRKLLIWFTAAVLVLGIPTCAFAAPAAGGIESVKAFASQLTNYVTAIAASVAVLFMAVNGIRYITSGGNPIKQSEAKNGIVSAGVGLAVALSANVLVQLVVSALG